MVGTIQTPREVKRLVGVFSVLERAVRGEICPYDVLGYCWVLTKSPSVGAKIAQHIDDLVNDPSGAGMAKLARNRIPGTNPPDVVEILGAGADEHEGILKLLFPSSTDESDTGGGIGLAKRRNLVRMLYLGDPPGAVRRAKVVELWGSPILPSSTAALLALKKEGKLAAFLDRLDDLVPQLPEAGDRTFWVALARALVRRSDWLAEPEEGRAIADDAAMILCRMVWRDRNRAPRLQATIDALIGDGDLALVPRIVRMHIFAHGLTVPSQNLARRRRIDRRSDRRTAEPRTAAIPGGSHGRHRSSSIAECGSDFCDSQQS